MYSSDIMRQLSVFLYSFGFGYVLARVYYALDRVFRLLVKRPPGHIGKGLYLTASAVAVYCLSLLLDMGKIRLYFIAALTLGLLACRAGNKKKIAFFERDGV